MFLLQPALNVGEASLAVCFETLWICSEMSPSCSKWWLVTFHQVWVYPPLLHPRWPSILPVCLYCPASTSASWDSYPWGSSHTDLCPDLCSEQGWSEQGELSGLGMAAGGNVREFLGSSLVKQEKPRLVVRIKRAREKTKTTQTAEGQERSHSLGHRWEAAVGSGPERVGWGEGSGWAHGDPAAASADLGSAEQWPAWPDAGSTPFVRAAHPSCWAFQRDSIHSGSWKRARVPATQGATPDFCQSWRASWGRRQVTCFSAQIESGDVRSGQGRAQK